MLPNFPNPGPLQIPSSAITPPATVCLRPLCGFPPARLQPLLRAFSRQALYGACQLEYIRDIDKLRTEYDFRAATHPLVGNPCTHTLYDPLKTTNLPGNIWIRGAIVQGSDVRPPLGVEIEVQDKQILAIRTE
jgi:hypothetical protein